MPACVFDDVPVVIMDDVNINRRDKRPQFILRNMTNESLKVDQRLVSTVE